MNFQIHHGCIVRLLPLAILLLAVGPNDLAQANPSSKHPQRPLGVHATVPEAREISQRLYDLFQSLETAALNMNLRSDNPAQLPYQKIQKGYVDLTLARRDAQLLQLMGEPAGTDLEYLVNSLLTEYSHLAINFRGTTAGSVIVQENIAQLKLQHPRNLKSLERVAVAIKNDQLESAEKELIKLRRDVYGLGYLLTNSQRNRYWEPVNNLLRTLDQKLKPVRRRQYIALAKEKANENLQQVNEFLAESSRVSTEIGATGKVTVDGARELSPPEAIRYLANEWGKASAALIRNVAIEWAFTQNEPSKTRAKTMPQVSQLSQTAKDAIIGVIDAAAVSTPADQVASMYSEILMAVSYVDRRVSGSGISKDAKAALERFAARDPDLPAAIASYHRAISQPLAWRSRFAKSHSEHLKSKYPRSNSVLTRKYQVDGSAKPEMYQGHGSKKRAVIQATLGGGVQWKIADASRFIVNARVSDSEILRLYEGSLTAIGHHSGLHYCNVAIGVPVQKAMDDLKISVLVNDQYPPLTIEAADAISSGQMQDFLEFGGAVQQMHLEAAVTRFATLPGRANQLVPLGTLPQLDDRFSTLNQACWRLDVEPHWVRHRYFTAAIRSKLPKAN